MRLRSELNGSSPSRGARRRLLLVAETALLGEHDERRPRSGRRATDQPASVVDEARVVAEQPRPEQLGERRRVDDLAVGAEPAERLVPGALDVDLESPASRPAGRSSRSRSACRSCPCR